MPRKRRTELPGAGESSEPQQAATVGQGGGAQRPQQPPQQQQYQQQQGGRGRGGQGQQGPYQGQGGPPQGGRGWAPRGPPQGGRVGGPPPPRGPQQQYPGDQPPQGRVFQQQQAPRGTAPSQRGVGSGPSMTPTPELHQATQAPQQPGVTMQPTAQVVHAGSSSNQPVHEAMAQLKPPSFQEEEPVQAPPASSKSIRFPLRPGKGSSGTRCIVKANHFFAELPDKDLHQYDVSFFFFLPKALMCNF